MISDILVEQAQAVLDIMSASRIKKRTRPLLTWVTLSE